MLSKNETRALPTLNFGSLASAGIVVAAVSAVALAGAWAFELIGGYVPCALCLEQRLAYYAAIPLGLAAVFALSFSKRIAAGLIALVFAAFVYNAVLGVYHAGAEWHFWPGPDTCEVVQDFSKPVGSLTKKLQSNRPVRCDEAALRIAGLSLAGYSILISAALVGLTGFALWRYRTADRRIS